MKRNHRSRWTLAELRWVEKHYGVTPTKEIARKLGRTPSAINAAAMGLGVSADASTLWSEEEMDVLRNEYARGEGIRLVMSLLPGRTRITIFQKARMMGITSARSWSDEECRVLAEHYPQLGTKVAGMIGRTAEAVKIKACEMGIGVAGLTKARKWSEEEISLLIINLDKSPAEIRLLFPNRTSKSVDKVRFKYLSSRR
ncbi:hypothetical protein IAE30_20255 [Pantoea sp. S61]|uniref:hypothetical protein n=1 Tax=Pantoea sp. S61 TaxID=2767442 RepID=UPI00190E1EB0|nr:hypothetical protein [Pantoea sp. S61]MBK0126077.1 hypothetical protein [Pantoea sp. S61]